MALLAAGLTTVLRSGVAALSILIPFLLIVSCAVGDMAGGRRNGRGVAAEPQGRLTPPGH